MLVLSGLKNTTQTKNYFRLIITSNNMAQSAQLLYNDRHADILLAQFESTTKTRTLTFTPDEDTFYFHPTASYYKNRACLHFNLTTEFLPHSVLVRGLIEFTRPKHLRFIYSADRKRMEIDLEVSQFDELTQLFRTVYSELRREIQFKAALRKAIEFEREYKRESEEVYLAVG
jgi:hypothetical protein